MSFLKRFAFYLGGFGVGTIFVILFLTGKGASCSYFPNARVLKEIQFKQQVISPEALAFLKKEDLDTLVIQKILSQGKVNFSESQTSTRSSCRIYIVNGQHQDRNLRLEIEECKETDSIATIKKAEYKPSE